MAGDAALTVTRPHQHAAFMRPGTAPVVPVDPRSGLGAADEASPSQSSLAQDAQNTQDAQHATPPVLADRSHLADEAISSRPGFVEPERPVTAAAAASGTADSAPADELVAGRSRSFGPGMKIAAGVVALAVAGGVFVGVRELTRRPSASTTVTSSVSASSGTPTPTAAPALTSAMLITAGDATKAFGAMGWQETDTLETIPATAPGITCMSNRQGLPNPVVTRQRGLVSTATSKSAILQRVDAYADATQAQKAYDITYAALAACNDVPAYISSADAITGAADESFSVTVAFEDEPRQYHTVIIARTGVSVTMVDGANDLAKLDTQKLLEATTPTLTRLSGPSKGTAPKAAKAAVTAVPSTPILGWLAESDLPRITAGQGRWSATEVAKVTTLGSSCENMTFATVAGPTQREQRSYLLNQDDAAPDQFGVDEVLFTFKDAKAATAFAKKVSDNIDTCTKRADTAKVSGGKNLSIVGQDRTPVSGKVWLVEQATGGNTSVRYRVGVTTANNRVTYTVSKVTASYDFAADAWLQLNARAGQRSTHTM